MNRVVFPSERLGRAAALSLAIHLGAVGLAVLASRPAAQEAGASVVQVSLVPGDPARVAAGGPASDQAPPAPSVAAPAPEDAAPAEVSGPESPESPPEADTAETAPVAERAEPPEPPSAPVTPKQSRQAPPKRRVATPARPSTAKVARAQPSAGPAAAPGGGAHDLVAAYRANCERILHERFRPAEVAESRLSSLQAMVRIHVADDGRITRYTFLARSNDVAFDQAVEAALQLGALPRPPVEIAGKLTGGLLLIFEGTSS